MSLVCFGEAVLEDSLVVVAVEELLVLKPMACKPSFSRSIAMLCGLWELLALRSLVDDC